MEKRTHTKLNKINYKIFNKVLVDEVIKETKEIIHTKVCRNKWFYGNELIVYSFDTCGIYENNCICSECFNHEEHIEYNYYIRSYSRLVYDCGDETNWRKPCPKHWNK